MYAEGAQNASKTCKAHIKNKNVLPWVQLSDIHVYYCDIKFWQFLKCAANEFFDNFLCQHRNANIQEHFLM